MDKGNSMDHSAINEFNKKGMDRSDMLDKQPKPTQKR
jgi:hypothetical protein